MKRIFGISMRRTSVVIVRGNDPKRMVERALKLIGAKHLITPKDKVLLKPNYVVAKHPSSGVTTDSHVVESLIEFVKSIGVMDIVVGEGGAGDTERAFDVVGVRDVVKRHKVKLINLNEDFRINVRVPEPLALEEVGVAKTALECTCIINIPKLKVHHMAVVTLSMKNLMGVILPKSIMHDRINEKIVDLALLFKDKVRINVVDGLVGAEVDETRGYPVKMDLIIAGRDMVAVDAVTAAVMGICPHKVKYLSLAEERGLGISNLEEIEVLGEKIEEVTKKFRV